MIHCIWVPVVTARHRIVDYYKAQIDLDEETQRKIKNDCSPDDYVACGPRWTAFNENYGIATNWRKTRVKLDRQLPWMFTLLWFALLTLGFVGVFGVQCKA